MNKALFLDTSIQISKRISQKNEVDRIKSVEKGFDLIVSSSYVLLEFKKSFIQDCIWLHRNLRELKSFGLVHYRLSALGAHIGHNRKRSTVSAVLASYFISNKNESSLDKDIAESVEVFLENVLDDIIDNFKESCDHISDEIHCVRAFEQPKQLRNGSFQARVADCKATKINCKLNTFFEKNKNNFKKIHNFIRENKSDQKKPSELNRIATAIEIGLDDSKQLCETRHCSSLGDALVAVEAVHYKNLITKDIDQSEVICEAIDLNSILIN